MRPRVLLRSCALLLLAGLLALAFPPLFTIDIPDGSPFEPIQLSAMPVSAVDVSPAGTLVLAGVDGAVLAWARGADEPVPLFRANVTRGPDWGLTGLALGPDFDETHRIFIAYVTGAIDGGSPVLRVASVEDEVETVLFETAAASPRLSGRLLLHNSSLYVGLGDLGDPSAALDVARPEGKILRMTLAGLPPADNPRASDDAWHPLAWSAGYSQPFGLAWDESRGRIATTDVDAQGEEVIAIASRTGDREDLLRFGEPLRPVGMDVEDGAFFVATFGTNEVLRLRDQDGVWRMETVHRHPTHLLDVEVSSDGAWAYFGAWDGLWTLALREQAWGQAESMPAPIAPPPLESVAASARVPGFGMPVLVGAGILAAALSRTNRRRAEEP